MIIYLYKKRIQEKKFKIKNGFLLQINENITNWINKMIFLEIDNFLKT
jgi:hypothetical protein